MSTDYGNYQSRPVEGASAPSESNKASNRLSMRITRVASSGFEELRALTCGRERAASLARALDNSKVLADYFSHKITGKSASAPSSARSSLDTDPTEVASQEEDLKPLEKKPLTPLEIELENLIKKIDQQTEELAEPTLRNDLLFILKNR